MAKNNLEEVVSQAAQKFALEIIEAVKSATLQELMALQGGAPAPRKPGPKSAAEKKEEAPKKPRKRVVKNYPKCAYPGCEKNRFPRGKGFCGDHWKMWQKGEIEDAEFYKSQS